MFKEKITKHLKEKGINVIRTEQEGDTESVVFHISKEDNKKIEDIKSEMESKFDVAVLLSDMGGFNVVIVESNDLE